MKRIFSLLFVLLLSVSPALSSAPAPSSEGAAAQAVLDISAEEFLSGSAQGEDAALTPWAPEGLTKTILGSDDRYYGDAASYPNSAVAQLYLHYPCCDKWLNPSGFMAGPDLLVTAAHCMVCMDHGGAADRVEAWFGFKNTKNFLYHFTGSTRYWYGTTFRQPDGSFKYTWQDQDRDYAYLILSERVGDVTGWFGLTSLSDTEIEGSVYTVSAYKDWTFQSSRGVAHPYNEYIFSHQADTLPGFSGGPVYDQNYYVVGINVSASTNENYAHRVTGGMLSEMRQNGAIH